MSAPGRSLSPADVWRAQLQGFLEARPDAQVIALPFTRVALVALVDLLDSVCDCPGSVCDHYSPCRLALDAPARVQS